MSAETDLQASITAAIKPLERIRLVAEGSFSTDETAALTAFGVTPDVAPQAQQVISALHSGVFGIAGYGGSCLNAFMPALGRLKGYPETDAATILARYFEDMVTAGLTVKSREISYNQPTDPGTPANSGNGVVWRLSKDQFNFNIENCFVGLKTWKCVADEHSGAQRWGETFRCYNPVASKSLFNFPGAGLVLPAVRAVSIRDSAAYIQDPGFDSSYNSTTGFSGWRTTSGGWTNITQETTRYYKDVLPNTNAYCAKFTASDGLYQTWSDQAINWNPSVPLYCQIAYMRQASATGTLRLRIGDQESTVSLASKNNDEWNVLHFKLAGYEQYFRQWNALNSAAAPATNPFIKIYISDLAVGTLLIDDVIIAPYSRFDGTWHVIVPGPENSTSVSGGALPFLRDDRFTATDTQAATGILQEWFARGTGAYLPSTSGTETWVDPSM